MYSRGKGGALEAEGGPYHQGTFMASEWIVLLAVLAPVAIGLLTLFLPRTWIERRTFIAAAGPAIAFALLVGVAIDNAPALQAQHDAVAHAAAHDDHDAKPQAAAHPHADAEPRAVASAEASGTSATTYADAEKRSDEASGTPAPLTTGTLEWMPSLQHQPRIPHRWPRTLLRAPRQRHRHTHRPLRSRLLRPRRTDQRR